LVRSVAQFEFAFLDVYAGSQECHEVLWDRHPDSVFVALEDGSELPPAEPHYIYRMKICWNLLGMVCCSRELPTE
jgi:hypothetical protein